VDPWLWSSCSSCCEWTLPGILTSAPMILRYKHKLNMAGVPLHSAAEILLFMCCCLAAWRWSASSCLGNLRLALLAHSSASQHRAEAFPYSLALRNWEQSPQSETLIRLLHHLLFPIFGASLDWNLFDSPFISSFEGFSCGGKYITWRQHFKPRGLGARIICGNHNWKCLGNESLQSNRWVRSNWRHFFNI